MVLTKLAFAILAHDRPNDLILLVRALLVENVTVVIHYDGRSKTSDFGSLQAAFSNCPEVHFSRRVKCGWGEYSLVQATLSTMEVLEEINWQGDYVYLLSGSDLPVKPIDELKKFLANSGSLEFIEAYKMHSQKWVKGGLFHERYQYRHFFNERKHPKLFRWSYLFQRKLRLKRKFLAGYTPRMGSQWWCLTWPTVKAVLAMSRQRSVVNFFKTVWIPDEMYFSTLVGKVAPDRVAGHSLTYFEFTDYGVPVVLHDDLASFVDGLRFFFARKFSPNAKSIRQKLLQRAQLKVTDADVSKTLGTRNSLYEATRQLHRVGEGQSRIIGRVNNEDIGDFEFAGSHQLLVFAGIHSGFLEGLSQRLKSQQTGIVVHGRLFHPEDPQVYSNGEALGYLRELAVEFPDILLSRLLLSRQEPSTFVISYGDMQSGIDLVAKLPNAHVVHIRLPEKVELTFLNGQEPGALNDLKKLKAVRDFQHNSLRSQFSRSNKYIEVDLDILKARRETTLDSAFKQAGFDRKAKAHFVKQTLAELRSLTEKLRAKSS